MCRDGAMPHNFDWTRNGFTLYDRLSAMLCRDVQCAEIFHTRISLYVHRYVWYLPFIKLCFMLAVYIQVLPSTDITYKCTWEYAQTQFKIIIFKPSCAHTSHPNISKGKSGMTSKIFKGNFDHS
jgi:hypothetical protein